MKSNNNHICSLVCLTILSLFLTTACREENSIVRQTKNYIQTQETVGVYSSSRALYLYEEDVHQLSFRPLDRTCCFQTDDQRSLLEMTLSDEPSEKKKLTLYISARGHSGLDKEYKVEVLAIDKEHHLVKLFNQVSLTGFLMYYEWQ